MINADRQVTPLLEVRQITKRFGGLSVLEDVSINVAQGEICGLIGPNGAGKTTLFNIISGIYQADRGQISVQGTVLTHRSPQKMAALGIGRTFQVPRVFNELSVRDNMLVPAIPRHMPSKDAQVRYHELLELVGLLPLLDQPAVALSGGQKKLLEFARVMMFDPILILLDEPFAGVAPSLTERLMEVTLHLNKRDGRSFFLVSHDIPCITRLCHTVVALAAGRLIAQGSPDHVRHLPEVVEAYLGH